MHAKVKELRCFIRCKANHSLLGDGEVQSTSPHASGDES
jgi:hypothetical protein